MKLLKLTFILIILSNLTFGQGKKYRSIHPFSGNVVFSSEFGFTHSYTDFTYPRPKLLSRGAIEFYLPVKSSNALGIKITGGLGSLNSYGRNDDEKFNNPNFITSLFLLGTGITYARKLGYSIPYISATISHLRIDPKDRNGKLLPNNLIRKYDLNLTMYTAELGIRFLVQNFWSVNMGMNYNFTNSDYVDDLKTNEQNDKFISLFFGLSFYYGGISYSDNDNDGIVDSEDVCPNTPAGIKVDEFGCAKDEKLNKHIIANKNTTEQKDIVQKKDLTQRKEFVQQNEFIQNEEVTPKKNNSLDSTKILSTTSIKDSDKDGVPDHLDKCPYTSIGATVNSFGCEVIIFTRKEDTEKSPKVVDVKKETPVKKKTKFKKVKFSYQFANEKALPELFFTDGNLFCFQVGALRNFEAAEELKKKLKESGHHPFVLKPKQTKNNDEWFRVRVGYFKSLRSAKKYKLKHRASL